VRKGEAAVKAAGAKYLPRLDAQTNDDYLAFQARACFFNATRRAADALVGLVCRKAPFVKIPKRHAAFRLLAVAARVPAWTSAIQTKAS
jgi:hypothetical protein